MSKIRILALSCSLALCACKDKPTTDDTAGPGEDTGDTSGDTGPQEPPSDYVAGTYEVTAMTILPSGEGFDLDDDGEVNNKLPSVLMALDMMVDDDMSADGLNATIAAAIKAGELVELLDARYGELTLEIDLLLGSKDEHGALSLDQEQSYDPHGVPYSRFQGVFLDQVTVELGPDDVQIPVAFYPDEPAIMIPVWQTIAAGELSGEAASFTMGGAVPVDLLMVQVVDPLIPEEGYGDQTKEELMETIESLLSSESISDIELEGEQRGISAALSFEATPATW